MIEFIKNLYYMVPTVSYCEQPTGGLIERPFYAISNIAFLIVGFLILSRGSFSRMRQLPADKKTPLSKAFGYSMIAVGLFSFVYDATYSYLFQLLDVAGMYIFITLVMYLNTQRLGLNLHKAWRWATLALGMIIFYFFKGEIGNVIFGLFILFVIISEWMIKEKISRKDWITGIVLFALGFGIWMFDATKLLCDPNNIFNGRGIFHLLEAAAVYYFYKHYLKLEKIYSKVNT